MATAHTFQDAATATGNGTALNVGTTGARSLLIQAVISATATVTFEGSVDGTNYNTITVTLQSDHTKVSETTASGVFQALNIGLYSLIRCRISSYGSGTVTVVGRWD